MNKKNMQIIVILIIFTIAILVVFSFFGIGGLTIFPSLNNQQLQAQTQTGQVTAQQILAQVQQQGSVSQLEGADITVGTGDPVQAGDTVSVKYTGVLPNGTVFDSTDAHGGKPFTFSVGGGQVIQGWEQGLIGMRVGGQRLLAIPPQLGYGANAINTIPANSTLIFEIQLISRTPTSAQGSSASSTTLH